MCVLEGLELLTYLRQPTKNKGKWKENKINGRALTKWRANLELIIGLKSSEAQEHVTEAQQRYFS